MDVWQKQRQLLALGYLDRADLDGQWGPRSAGATRAFQAGAGLREDGLFGPATEAASRQAVAALQRSLGVTADGLAGPVTLGALGGASLPDFWQEIPNFTREEFACKCGRFCDGYPAEPREALVRIAQAARDHFGRPAVVVSGLRCRQHNANVGGVANSQHMAGEACDLAIAGVGAEALLAFFQSHPGVRYAYQINDTNVHFDIPKGGGS